MTLILYHDARLFLFRVQVLLVRVLDHTITARILQLGASKEFRPSTYPAIYILLLLLPVRSHVSPIPLQLSFNILNNLITWTPEGLLEPEGETAQRARARSRSSIDSTGETDDELNLSMESASREKHHLNLSGDSAFNDVHNQQTQSLFWSLYALAPADTIEWARNRTGLWTTQATATRISKLFNSVRVHVALLQGRASENITDATVSREDLIVDHHVLTKKPQASQQPVGADGSSTTHAIRLEDVIDVCNGYTGKQKLATMDTSPQASDPAGPAILQVETSNTPELEKASFSQLVQTLHESVAALKNGSTPLNFGTCLAEMFLLRSQLIYLKFSHRRLRASKQSARGSATRQTREGSDRFKRATAALAASRGRSDTSASSSSTGALIAPTQLMPVAGAAVSVQNPSSPGGPASDLRQEATGSSFMTCNNKLPDASVPLGGTDHRRVHGLSRSMDEQETSGGKVPQSISPKIDQRVQRGGSSRSLVEEGVSRLGSDTHNRRSISKSVKRFSSPTLNNSDGDVSSSEDRLERHSSQDNTKNIKGAISELVPPLKGASSDMPAEIRVYAKLERCEAEKFHAEQQIHLLEAKIGPLETEVLELRARLGFAEAEVRIRLLFCPTGLSDCLLRLLAPFLDLT